MPSMVIITKTIPGEFAQKYPDEATALNDWYKLVKVADWNNLPSIKQTFNRPGAPAGRLRGQ